jgi:hypothetical protein
VGTHPRRLHRSGGARHGRKRPGYIRCSSATHSPPANRRPPRRSAGRGARGRLRDRVLGSPSRSLPAAASPRRCGFGVKAESKSRPGHGRYKGLPEGRIPVLGRWVKPVLKEPRLAGLRADHRVSPATSIMASIRACGRGPKYPQISGKSHHQAPRRAPYVAKIFRLPIRWANTYRAGSAHACQPQVRS